MPTIADWSGFFTAELGTAATLGGLVFVGLSLNLPKILSNPVLPNRALLAVSVLLGILLVASFAIIPGQSQELLGVEIVFTGLLFSAFSTYLEIYMFRNMPLQNRLNFFVNMTLLEASFLPYVVGGALLIAGGLGGLYWMAGGIILSFVKAVTDSWVLVVEINR